MSQTGDLDVDLLLITSNDWYEIRDIHAEMAVFRSIENGVPVFRQARGVSLATDAYGRVISSTDSFDGVLRQDANVPLNATATLYPAIGGFLSWAAFLGLVGMLAWAWIAGRRHARDTEGPVEVEPEERKLVNSGQRTG